MLKAGELQRWIYETVVIDFRNFLDAGRLPFSDLVAACIITGSEVGGLMAISGL